MNAGVNSCNKRSSTMRFLNKNREIKCGGGVFDNIFVKIDDGNSILYMDFQKITKTFCCGLRLE